MTGGSCSWSNSESDELRLLGGPPIPTLVRRGLAYRLTTHLLRPVQIRTTYHKARSSASSWARADQLGPARHETSGECAPGNHVLPRPPFAVCVGGIPTRWTTKTPRILAGPFWVSDFLSTLRLFGCWNNKIVPFGLACVCDAPHGQKLTRAGALSHQFQLRYLFHTQHIFL